MGPEDLVVRRARLDELDAVIDVAAAALGWPAGEPHDALFRWKHLHNAFGVSPMWVAEASDGRLAGFRAFLRWELRRSDGTTLRAVRAVDTATHPDFQRQGVFSRLTSAAVAEMEAEGVDLVFNTPNDQSRPGYLKLGWAEAGRLPVAIRPASPAALLRILRARVPAAKWSLPSAVGEDAASALADAGAVTQVLASQPSPHGLATAWTAEALAWRYRFAPLHYRVWAPEGMAAGFVVCRVRARGSATECSVTHVLAPDADVRRVRTLLRGLAGAVDADYLLTIGHRDLRAGLLPLPGQGPRLTTRRLGQEPPVSVRGWDLHLGDIELF